MSRSSRVGALLCTLLAAACLLVASCGSLGSSADPPAAVSSSEQAAGPVTAGVSGEPSSAVSSPGASPDASADPSPSAAASDSPADVKEGDPAGQDAGPPSASAPPTPRPSPSATPQSYRPEEEVDGQWTIAETSVVSEGRRDDAGPGTLRSGYVVRGDAVSKDAVAGVTRRAVFEVTLTAFCPDRDLPGQEKGRWYVDGAWVLRGRTAEDVRHSDGVLQGTLKAEATSDPAAADRPFVALMRLPMWLAGQTWQSGEGTFSGTTRFKGTLVLTIEQIETGAL